MAETVPSFVAKEALSRVGSLITHGITLAWNLKDDLEVLQDLLNEILAVLQDAEEQQIESAPVRLWLKKLKDVAYDAEEVLDELGYEILRREAEMHDQQRTEVSSCDLFFELTNYAQKTAFRFKVACKVKKINETLAMIKNEAIMVHGLIQVPSSGDHTALDRMTDSVPDNPVVGRDQDVLQIVKLLSRFCSGQEVLTIVPIVGMGGLGKTASAKLVCQEAMSTKLFDVKMWICVYDNFNDLKIFGEMLQSLRGGVGGLTNKDAILSQLEKELEGKKFLLVLDDVCGDALKEWEDLKSRLLTICSKNGNAIIVTTRSEEVASVVETSSECRHILKVLSDEDCWSIMETRVHANGGAPIPLELVNIGKELAEKCRGVPLAAKVLGGCLNFKREKEAWLSIKNSKVLNATYKKDNVEAILKLSFDHLPSYLKPCFVYCSIFPKDVLIEKEVLIQLWMAEGFLEPSNGDVGNKYFNALLCYSFFQDVEMDKLGNIVKCKVHDLVHDLAISLSKSEILTSKSFSKGEVDLSYIRHVNIDSDDVKNAVIGMDDGARKLRTIFSLKEDVVFDESWKLEYLRSLKLKGSAVVELPSSIGEWKHLRYLDVSETNLKALPESITKLYSLQTLRFLWCRSLVELPRKKMKNLVSLKHIEFSYDWQMPSELRTLTSLERLPMFVVGSDRGGSIEELECLNELRGELRIQQLEKVRDKEEAEKAKLQEKQRITALEFVWSEDRGGSCSNDEEVLDGLHPHSKIKKIRIDEYKGKNFPAWVMKMKIPGPDSNSFTLLESLMELKLKGCKFCEKIPGLGILPNLRYLEIDGMAEVKCIGNEFYGIDDTGRKLFPELKRLSLRDMKNLIEWRAPEVVEGERVGELFPHLEELTIDRCHELGNLNDEVDSFPSFKSLRIPSLKSLRISKCSSLKSIPLQSFTSLEKLYISECEMLASIPEELAELSCLTHLHILNCKRLSYFPRETLGSLTRLKSFIVFSQS